MALFFFDTIFLCGMSNRENKSQKHILVNKKNTYFLFKFSLKYINKSSIVKQNKGIFLQGKVKVSF